ncbi:radical SAM/CxCxxxxC motif protein YfkAB [Paenibacillus sp. N1-5-1-14]|uniref:radical SAM/CxCxxxxC motif protein YfkAB n=1 Tax=Paenibacillus radicibacter TaxID=2972488 RepID=UPI00215995CC|nr:radical SAM/CxCxxxxC motif protein YfkAB [Paenibacillus radicibacter]MCR8643682.1 radical SAM/CxCxxxxC motif protein YfkAB [Paenibacillus radicibacter]
MNLNSQVANSKQPISTIYDPWDPIRSYREHKKHVLTSVEVTMSNLCNMRCEHCAVGDTLTMTEPEKLPISLLLQKLDEVEHLETLSITGGEPTYSKKTVTEYIVPLLKYCSDRGIRTQINSNLTLDLARYEEIAPYLDVMHISFNYLSAEDFHAVGFVRANHEVALSTAAKMYDRMVDNTIELSKAGMYISAETMINYRTHTKLAGIHKLIDEMGCKRHEVHPMYPSSFASNLPLISLDQIRTSLNELLDVRNPEMWMLFGTLPFYACSTSEQDHQIVQRLRNERNVTVRNDPDGRNRLNVNLFTGDVYITDFADLPAQGNIYEHSLDEIFSRWESHSLNQLVNCYCEAAACCGPNLLVAHAYYQGVDFKQRKAVI